MVINPSLIFYYSKIGICINACSPPGLALTPSLIILGLAPCTNHRLAAKAEWEMLYKVAKDKDGRLPKDTVRAVYDGTLFYQLTAQGKKA